MINISSLNKIYKSKSAGKICAINDIDLILPDVGLILICGKSGSGKSTLLNLIGGLDQITSGKIEVNGRDLSKLKEVEFCDYRNDYIGFIFQDYQLIDELTVFENVALSLNLQGVEDAESVKRALQEVELTGYENKYPTELSGGEKQRVAIARAIVKKPHIILADEPAGNLDRQTAATVIEQLKKLSKNCLVILVSHNLENIDNYADRVIELSAGRVVADKVLDRGNREEGERAAFEKKEVTESGTDKKEHRGLKRRVKLSVKLLKHRLLSLVLATLMIASIMIILSLAQTIIRFDANEAIRNEMNKMEQTSLVLHKKVPEDVSQRLEQSYRNEVGEKDIEEFYKEGVSGEIYPLYNPTIPIIGGYNALNMEYTYWGDSIYIKETLGTLIVDEEFLLRKFGELDYIAESKVYHPLGVIITDYVADAIIESPYKTGMTYDELLGAYSFGEPNQTRRIYINAIIDTGYKQRYEKLIENYADEKKLNPAQIDDLISLSVEIDDCLGYTYTLNQNFVEDYKNNKDIEIMWSNKLCFDDLYTVTDSYYFLRDLYDEYGLQNGEVALNVKEYNEIFGTNYTKASLSSFKPHKTKISQYRYYDVDCGAPLVETEVTIAKLLPDIPGLMIVSEDIYAAFAENCIIATGLYFDDADCVSTILGLCDELNYSCQMVVIEGIYAMTQVVEVFIPIFELISIFLYIGVVLILVHFSSKMIKDKLQVIGILKALGMKNREVLSVFGLHELLIVLTTCILSTLGYFWLIDITNEILVESLYRFSNNWVFTELRFLTFRPNIAACSCVLIGGLTIISLIVPMIKIKAIKPIDIIKAR